MKILSVEQGSSEWHAARAQHFCASEAPAMMGASKYMTRGELLKQKATGISEEIDSNKQRLFDRGHAAERSIRPVIETLIGEELYPATGVDGELLSSFDGLSMDESVQMEHKLWNEALAESVRTGALANDPAYYWQLEHQHATNPNAKRTIFVVSDGTPENCVHMFYEPVPGRRDQLLAGWAQFKRDLADYKPQPVVVEAVGRAPDSLPALRIELTGMVTTSNLAEFKDHAIAVFRGIKTDLKTDQDFADADKTVKWCGEIEDKLKAAKEHALSQTQSIDELFRTIDAIGSEARAKRLELEKLVKARKESVRVEILQAGKDALAEHVAQINKTLGGKIRMPDVVADFAGVMKGKKTVSSLQDAVDTELARCKIAADRLANSIRINLELLRTEAAGYETLFMDAQQLVTSKAEDDLRNLITSRIAEHKAREQARLDAEREQIRREEEQRAQQEAERLAEAERARIRDEERQRAQLEATQRQQAAPAANTIPEAAVTTSAAVVASDVAQQEAGAAPTPADSGARMKLGDINARIAPLAITAEGLAQLGFQSVGTERAAKLYRASDFPRICGALVAHLQRTQTMKEAA